MTIRETNELIHSKKRYGQGWANSLKERQAIVSKIEQALKERAAAAVTPQEAAAEAAVVVSK